MNTQRMAGILRGVSKESGKESDKESGKESSVCKGGGGKGGEMNSRS